MMTRAKTSRPMRAEVFKRKDGLWDFRFVAPNGVTVGSTSQGFSSKGNARRGIGQFVDRMSLGVDVVEVD